MTGDALVIPVAATLAMLVGASRVSCPVESGWRTGTYSAAVQRLKGET